MRPSPHKIRSYLLSLALLGIAAQASAATTVGMAFNPSNIASSGTSTLGITLTTNNAVNTAFVAVALPTLPAGLTYTGNSSTTCSGLGVTATVGSGLAAVVGVGTVPAQSSCSISLEVQAPPVSAPVTYQTTLPAGVFVILDLSGASVPGTSLTASLTVQPQSGQIAISSNVFNPAVSGGALPTVGLNCGSAVVGGAYPHFSVPVGSSCVVTAVGAVAPANYALTGSTTFGGIGVNSTGAFTVPEGGISDVSVTTHLTFTGTPGNPGNPGSPGNPGTPGNPVPAPVSVIEFYHSDLNHYFMTANPGEIEDLDTGVHQGWERTGHSFLAYDVPVTGTNPVCRFYMKPEAGDSHFYSASPQECLDTAARFSEDWIAESPNVFYIALPDTNTGACAPNTQPVWRFFHEPETNHRYTADIAVRDLLRSTSGWIAEGYGPEAVIMCAPL